MKNSHDKKGLPVANLYRNPYIGSSFREELLHVKRIICLCFLIGFCASVGKSWHIAKDGFSFNRTLCQLNEMGIDPQDDRIEAALAQTYSYLGRGHQCYAFGSEDGKYVIKLPRYDRYQLSFFLKSCRFAFLDSTRDKIRADLKNRLQFIHESFRIAFEELQEDTAVVCLHLHKSSHLKKELIIKDRLGRSYRLDPNRSAFILQEKKEIMMNSFQQCLKRGDRRGAEEILDSFLALIESRARKGIYNKDPSFLRNFGWEKGRGIQIDIGSYYRKPAKSGIDPVDNSFLETLDPVRGWLSEIDPELYKKFETKIEKIRGSRFSEDG